MTEQYDASEQDAILETFSDMLATVTRDGGRKRAAGTKPPWWRDDSHAAASRRHGARWELGEKVDPDSGAHPLVHRAWRDLAIAYQETVGQVPPASDDDGAELNNYDASRTITVDSDHAHCFGVLAEWGDDPSLRCIWPEPDCS